MQSKVPLGVEGHEPCQSALLPDVGETARPGFGREMFTTQTQGIKRRQWGEMEGYKLRGRLEAGRRPDKIKEKEKKNSSWLPGALPWDVLNGNKPSQSAVPLRLLSLARLTGVGAGLQAKRVHLITRRALERGALSVAAQEELASLQVGEHHRTAPPLTSHASSTHLPHSSSSHCSHCYHE